MEFLPNGSIKIEQGETVQLATFKIDPKTCRIIKFDSDIVLLTANPKKVYE